MVLIYPKGCNGVCNGDHLSVYLVVASPEYLPHIWSRYAEFSLSVVNQMYQQSTLRKDAQHKFNRRESDWGFTSFIPLCKLHDPKEGFLVNGTLIIEAEVADGMVVDYDSKMKTGYVGVKNQGATSYINSLLQTLYHIPYFRKAVYRMPMKEKDMQSRSIILALQNLFFKLQYSDESVATKELIQSFGREIYDSSMQHDVQELNRVLCKKIEDKMKRKESFYDLQLDVKDCQDVYASFDKYIKVECLEGDNKYRTGQNGLQDAMKGILFLDFPPVLQLQLKRFEYDYAQNTVVKINDGYEFPLELDLDRENGKYLSPDCDRRVRNFYTLHSVLVHNGGEHGGRYYAFIRPNLSHQWLKFDDELVTKEDMIRALEERYGGEEELPQTNGFNSTPFKLTKYSNAYMLVYIRKSDIEKVICNADVQDIVKPVRLRLKKEHEENEHKKKEAQMHTIIKVARNEDFVEQGNVAKEFGIPVKFQRFWLWTKRQNLTYHPHRQLTPEEETQSDLHPIQLPETTKEDILIFFKLYDPIKEELIEKAIDFHLSQLRWEAFREEVSGSPYEILTKLNKMAGFSSTQQIELYEELKFEPSVMCEPIHKKLTFRANQLGDGDILCFQKSPPVQCLQQCRYPDVPSFFEYVHNRLVVHFRSLAKPKEDAFCLQLSNIFNYDEVVESVARQLLVDVSSKIRLTPHNCYSQQPEPIPIRYRVLDHLSDMLVQNNQTAHILYYEVLDIPLPELECLKTLKVSFHHDEKEEIFQTSESIENINDQNWTLRAEEIPEEEKNCGAHDHIIHVYHFTKDTSQNQMLVQNFGKPFLLVIHDGETLADVKVRIQKKLQVPVPDLCKLSIALFLYWHWYWYWYWYWYELLQCTKKRTFCSMGAVSGLEHSDIAPNRLHAANQVMNTSLMAPLIPATASPTTNEDLELSMAIAASIHSSTMDERPLHTNAHKSVLVSKPVDWINSSENSSTPNNRGPTRGPASPLEGSSSRWSYKPAQVGYNGWDVPSNSETQQSIPSTCVICLDAPIEGACIPCGHLSGCMSCLNEIQGKKWGCPVCRAKIKQVVKIYAVSERRLLIFPKGNNVKFLSVYLDGADSANLPYGWSRFAAEFDLSVVNQMNGRDTAKMFVMSSPLSFSQIEKSICVYKFH
ncbi:hypothetical protein IFM89_019099 [Coptis chinensis]|uniref:ubiquitinyl hydrolase 1 n=1 Tax=Coptis chinensis TaxID=261450 RepID=A0A835HN43_9MAGN|nr:hypothetical protein IFM89_019099 [Coptis chinensis]